MAVNSEVARRSQGCSLLSLRSTKYDAAVYQPLYFSIMRRSTKCFISASPHRGCFNITSNKTATILAQFFTVSPILFQHLSSAMSTVDDLCDRLASTRTVLQELDGEAKASDSKLQLSAFKELLTTARGITLVSASSLSSAILSVPWASTADRDEALIAVQRRLKSGSKHQYFEVGMEHYFPSFIWISVGENPRAAADIFLQFLNALGFTDKASEHSLLKVVVLTMLANEGDQAAMPLNISRVEQYWADVRTYHKMHCKGTPMEAIDKFPESPAKFANDYPSVYAAAYEKYGGGEGPVGCPYAAQDIHRLMQVVPCRITPKKRAAAERSSGQCGFPAPGFPASSGIGFSGFRTGGNPMHPGPQFAGNQSDPYTGIMRMLAQVAQSLSSFRPLGNGDSNGSIDLLGGDSNGGIKVLGDRSTRHNSQTSQRGRSDSLVTRSPAHSVASRSSSHASRLGRSDSRTSMDRSRANRSPRSSVSPSTRSDVSSLRGGIRYKSPPRDGPQSAAKTSQQEWSRD